MLPDPEIRQVTLNDYLKILKRRRKLIVILVTAIPLIVAIVVFSMKPIYRATVSILIEKSPPKITKFEELRQAQMGFLDLQQYYQTQYKILSSRTLAEKIFAELNLGAVKEFQNEKDPVDKLMENINIEPVKNSQIVLLHVEDTDAARSSMIANALAKAYLQQYIENRGAEAKEATKWLEIQLAEIKKKAQESEEALNSYIQETKMVSTPVTSDVEKKIKSLLEVLKEERAKAETDLASALKRYKEKHPKIIAMRADLNDLNNKIDQETASLLDLNQKMVRYNILKKEAQANQGLYDAMLTRMQETNLSEKLETTIARIVDEAKVPDHPYRPKKALDIILSVFFALFCGIGISFILEYLESSVYTAEDINAYLRLPFLGYITSFGNYMNVDYEKDAACHKRPDSVIAENCRTAMDSILFLSSPEKPLKSILITSATPKEGVTLVASNLATVFSQAGENTLLLDATMRASRMCRSFDVSPEPGLKDFLAGNAALLDIIKPTFVKGLSVITSCSGLSSASSALSSDKVRSFMETLKVDFDRIIIDCPPILSVADASLLVNNADGVILVIKGGHTRLDVIIRAKEAILQAKGNILGVLIDDVRTAEEDRGYYNHYYENKRT
ncbi:MAG: polysaccharide biosynthesis tyrosine autokinase [Candidatus Omnitrophica bacterium]|nr:polysaccharide biosynthesis tyrosine autokinase [Candidatus Omnitrophota bacterium]